jgi:hypothetical protein
MEGRGIAFVVIDFGRPIRRGTRKMGVEVFVQGDQGEQYNAVTPEILHIELTRKFIFVDFS